MATVKSLSQMMSGAIGAGGDCETCGPGVTPTKVTRIAVGNLAKLNAPVQRAVAQPVPVRKPIQANPVEKPLPSVRQTQAKPVDLMQAQQVLKAVGKAVGIEEEIEDEKPIQVEISASAAEWSMAGAIYDEVQKSKNKGGRPRIEKQAGQ